MKLSEFLKTSKNARRVFGKKELKIMEKQLKGIRLTQSESNRLSRDIKPKLGFIKEAAAFSADFQLGKNQENKKLIEKAVQVIQGSKWATDITAILLFGSHAENAATFRSDIDIAAVFKKNLPLEEATKFRIRISGQLSDKFDIQVFNTLPQKIKREIARNHKVLYRQKDYNNLNFTIQYIKDNDYFIRMKRIFGVPA